MVWRVVESAGLCGAIGAGFALMVALILFWRGEPAVAPVLWLMGLGAFAGGIWGWVHRPSLLQTAILIDKQLGLHDLLSTSLSSQQWGDDAFHGIIQEQAMQRCLSISPNELVLRRLGSRQWGGIGLAGAIVFTVGLMSGQVAPIQAQRDGSAGGPESIVLESALEKRTQTAVAQPWNSPQPSENKRVASNEDSDALGRNGATRNAEGNSTGRSTAAEDSGSAAGRTHEARVPTLETSRNSISDALAGTVPGSGGPAVTTGGTADPSGYSQPSPAGPAAPPWESQSWPQHSARATQQITSGRVPDAYRDMVREYFRQDP